MSSSSKKYPETGDTFFAHTSFLLSPDEAGSAAASSVARLIWLDAADSSVMAEQETCTLPAEEERLLVLAVDKGSLHVGSEQLTATLLRGQAILIPPGTSCTLTMLDAGRILKVYLRGTLIGDVMQSYFEQQKLFCPAGLSDVREAIHAREMAEDRAEQISAAAYHLLMRLHETASLYEAQCAYPLLVDAGIGIMQEEFTHLYGVDEVAERLGVTTAHFTRLFSQTVGIPPGRFLKQQKLNYAKKLLVLPETTVALVAEMLGFSNVNYFSKVFRKENGMTPAEYRKLNRVSMSAEADKDVQDMLQELYL